MNKISVDIQVLEFTDNSDDSTAKYDYEDKEIARHSFTNPTPLELGEYILNKFGEHKDSLITFVVEIT